MLVDGVDADVAKALRSALLGDIPQRRCTISIRHGVTIPLRRHNLAEVAAVLLIIRCRWIATVFVQLFM
jgi:hypothetical protein